MFNVNHSGISVLNSDVHVNLLTEVSIIIRFMSFCPSIYHSFLVSSKLVQT